jgi:2-oxoglutarate dehydrogenase complex dehydrogenase (E1) component-like enzyme
VRDLIEDALRPGLGLRYAGRPGAAAPAGGSLRVHRRQQAALLAQAFEGD